MARQRKQQTQAPATAGIELAQSGPVFERARRLTAALFGGHERAAAIVLVQPDRAWRDHEPPGAPPHSPGASWVVAHRELLWVEDASQHPLLADYPPVVGPPHMRFYIAAPIRLRDGSIPGVLSFGSSTPRAYDKALAERVQDIADFVADEWTRATAARERRQAEATLAAVVASTPFLLVLLDREMRVLDASPSWFQYRGFERQASLGRSLFEIDPVGSLPWRGVLEQVLRGKPYYADKVRVFSDTDRPRWMQASVAPWRDPSGEIAGAIIASHDITLLVDALEASARSEERLKLAVEMARLHVWELDLATRKFFQMAGTPITSDGAVIDEAPENDPWRLIHPEDAPRVREAWALARTKGSPFSIEYRVRTGDGGERWVASRVRTVADPEGRPQRLLGAAVDITEPKVQQQALLDAKEIAEGANRAKSAFLATVSHEIRTPLNGLLGMAAAMALGELDPGQRERLDVIRSSGEGLVTILNELLDLSKIEAGKLTLEDAEFDVGDLAKSACATFQAVAENKGLTISCRVSRGARGAYRGDPMRVRQVLHNLLSNALKFTEAGGVGIAVSRRGGQLQIEVADSGIGMSARQLDKLFQAFEQAEASTSRRYGGTGLGLSICRELVELMGGRISVRSASGRGTCFTVRLPLAKVAGAAPATEAAPRAGEGPAERQLRVLAAEDNSVNQLVLRTLLSQVGIQPVMVADGRAAVEAWAREPWDLILMDVEMPGMGGLVATAEIRAREAAEGRPRTPIVALTGNVLDDQVARCLAAGMDAHVEKPIAASRLFATVQAALAARPDRTAEAAA